MNEIVKDALPLQVAETLRDLFLKAHFEPVKQDFDGKYETEFKSECGDLPKADERYQASFDRSRNLAADPVLQAIYLRWIAPVLAVKFGTKGEGATLFAYRMTAGDHFRVHVDGNSGPLGFILYLSKGWKWDWGGILMTLVDGVMQPTLPRFNSLVLTDHGKKPPHFVTPVAAYAREPRYMLVGFLKP